MTICKKQATLESQKIQKKVESLVFNRTGGDHLKLGNNIRRCRFDMNEMSQEELAKRVEVTRQTIISIEKGKFAPSALLAFKIARVFGKSIEEVFFIINEH